MKKYRDQKYIKVNADDFINFKTPYHVYLLGFIWADGYILIKYKRKEIRVEITSDDMDSIKYIFNKTGEWYFNTRKRENRKMQTMATCNNAKLTDFLVKYKYDKKSVESPTIITDIPDNYKKYFLRGWIDGDGCFYSNGITNHFSICGTYNQKWDYLETLLSKHNIHYKVSKKIAKNGNKCSSIRIWRKKDIETLFHIVYESNYDGIGLERKFNKVLSIIKPL
jgi:hypothetical protein